MDLPCKPCKSERGHEAAETHARAGAVLLTGGFGTLTGIFFGTLTLGIVQQGINHTSFDRNLSSLITGAMLHFAVS